MIEIATPPRGADLLARRVQLALELADRSTQHARQHCEQSRALRVQAGRSYTHPPSDRRHVASFVLRGKIEDHNVFAFWSRRRLLASAELLARAQLLVQLGDCFVESCERLVPARLDEPAAALRTALAACEVVDDLRTVYLDGLGSPLVKPGVSDDWLAAEVARAGDRAVLFLIGELDIAYSDRVAALLLSLAEPEVVVDMTGLSFMDLAGLDTLSTVRSTLAKRGQQLRVIGAGSSVRRLLALADAEDLLDGSSS